tara:strand:- start:1613 stop:1870 length:258 start_codon:yes stop_codon:yes gene_type:complete
LKSNNEPQISLFKPPPDTKTALDIYHGLNIYERLHYDSTAAARRLESEGLTAKEAKIKAAQVDKMTALWRASTGGVFWAAIMQGR